MKLLFTLIFALFALAAAAQVPTGYAALPKDSATQKVSYTAVVPVAGASKSELFSRAQQWGARAFTNYGCVY